MTAPLRAAPEGCPLSSGGGCPHWPGPPAGRVVLECLGLPPEGPRLAAGQAAGWEHSLPRESETTPSPLPLGGASLVGWGGPAAGERPVHLGSSPSPPARVHFGSVCTWAGGGTCPSDPVCPGELGGTQHKAGAPGAAGALRSCAGTEGAVGARPHTYSVVVHLLECLVADGALKDDPLEQVGFVTGHQLHADHLSLPHRHVAEHLGRGTRRTAAHHADHGSQPGSQAPPPANPPASLLQGLVHRPNFKVTRTQVQISALPRTGCASLEMALSPLSLSTI